MDDQNTAMRLTDIRELRQFSYAIITFLEKKKKI